MDTDIQFIKGVGPKLGSLFHKRGIYTIWDLLHYYPRAFEDRRAARNIASLEPGDLVSLKAKVVKVSSFAMGRSVRKIYDVLIKDDSGQIHCKYFRVPYKGYFDHIQKQEEVRVVGKVIDYRGRKEFHHPDIKDLQGEEEIQDDVLPIYTEIENLTSAKIARLIQSCLSQLAEHQWPKEYFPGSLLEQKKLISHKEALLLLHKPQPQVVKELQENKSEAHHRLIFEEFFWLELFLAAKKTGLKKEKASVISADSSLLKQLIDSLPFPLTNAQKRVLKEIQKDLSSGEPMNRLAQGDVGSGKTLIAFAAAMDVASAGLQSCLMVPTEILAEQHFKNAQNFLAPVGLRIALLTGRTKSAERKLLLESLKTGQIDLLIGTHALIEDDVDYKNLGLIVVDEQHRFGVAQRGLLKTKGFAPHTLVMTATPIPRTLALTVYGDLDVSVVDELPPGRSPIQTRVIFENKRPAALQFMLDQIKLGRQAYIVYPLVDESEKIDLKNALEEFEKLKVQFPQLKIGLLHGRMKSDEKDEVMNQFRSGEFQVLVSTTVIEVGVDVPNANLMMIEHAERFGLSQLHQLRGRVGRGKHKSFCVLILGRAVSDEARARTQFMEQTSDGFKIAEFDLEMRGPGEFLGTRQSGLPGFNLANLVRDQALLQEARDSAFSLMLKDPLLQQPENKGLRENLLAAHGPAALAGIA
jgi:ATP-dependent DNA helicase RecG